MRRSALALCSLVLLAGCPRAPGTEHARAPEEERGEPEPSVDERFFEAASRLLEDDLEANPMRAVTLGLHKYDGRVRDMSAEGLAGEVTRLRVGLEELRSYAPHELRPRSRVEQAALITNFEAQLFELEVRRSPWRNPMVYVSEIELTPYISRDYAPLSERSAALARAAHAGVKLLEQAQANLEDYLPRTFVDTALLQVRGTISFVEVDIPAAMKGLSAKDQAELDAALAELAAGLRDYESFLEGRQASATEDFRLGPERFIEMLERTQGLAIDLPTLRSLGEQDLERNLAAAEAAGAELDQARPLAELMAEVNADKPAPDQVLAVATQQAEDTRRFLVERGLVTIPDDEPVRVVETPPFMRWNMAFLDGAGPFEETPLPSFYYISPPDPSWPAEQQQAYVPSHHDLLFITVHEVWPGHFLHYRHLAANDSHILQALWTFTTGEGWAHYAEQMMWEEGLSQDPRVHLGQLQNALLRDVRFVSAIGLHTGDMSLEASAELFETQAFQSPASARQQAVRGTFDPMYLGYTLGKLLILELRADWLEQRRAAGEDDSLRAFHDELLSYGAAPLPAIRRAMLEG